MTVPFYVPPEQLIKDRAEFARKGIARGRSVLALSCADGIVLIAENASPTLRKLGEIYDRIGFAAVGRYSEFESLRQAGVRYADVRGYSYDRADVSARGLANAYAQTLAGVFSGGLKPFEVELLVAELGDAPEADRILRVSFDGSLTEEGAAVVIGGEADAVRTALEGADLRGLSLDEAVALGCEALATGSSGAATDVETAVLDRTSTARRRFRRLTERSPR